MTRWFRVDVPICSFRPYEARDYQETLTVPPPSTVLGMLLSLLGKPPSARADFSDASMCICVEPTGRPSVILRRMRRDPANRRTGEPAFRPEYQELLADLVLWVGLRGSLAEAVDAALTAPAAVVRFGAVSLGESTSLVDAVTPVPAPGPGARVLQPAREGDLLLTTEVDYAQRARTRVRRFALVDDSPTDGDFLRIDHG